MDSKSNNKNAFILCYFFIAAMCGVGMIISIIPFNKKTYGAVRFGAGSVNGNLWYPPDFFSANLGAFPMNQPKTRDRYWRPVNTDHPADQ